MLSWPDNRELIIKTARRASGSLAIVLKTHNEDELLEKWIKHHAEIVGLNNIIIADNKSKRPKTVEALESVKNSSCVFSYEGFHNTVHDKNIFSDLFEVLHSQCRYVVILDTDEFLCHFDNGVFWSGEKTAAHLQTLTAEGIVPTTWLQMHPSNRDWAKMSSSPQMLINGMKWGKPLVNQSVWVTGANIHNYQWPARFYNADCGGKLFLLHHTHFSPERRLRTNKAKLVARGFAENDDSFDILISKWKNQTTSDHTIDRLMAEIEEALSPDTIPDKQSPLPSDVAEVLLNDKCTFGSLEVEETFTEFIAKENSHIQRTLGCRFMGIEDLPRNEPRGLLQLARDLSAKGNEAAAEEAFKAGVLLYPKQLDDFGDRVFPKELLRLYLKQKDMVSSFRLSETLIKREDKTWAALLFARAFSAQGSWSQALWMWHKVSAFGRNNAEAKAQLSSLFQPRKIPELGFNRGLNVARDILNAYPQLTLGTIIDVGANQGDRVAEFRASFPNAVIYALEPVTDTFTALSRRFSDDSMVKLRQCALGNRNGHAQVTNNLTSTDNHICDDPQNNEHTECVDIKQGVDFCAAEGLESISYLKIDTEGHDLQVLQGFERKLDTIMFIEVEAGMNRLSTKHVLLEKFEQLLRPRGFEIFGIYDQVMEFTEYPALRRANVVFVNPCAVIFGMAAQGQEAAPFLPEKLLALIED